MTPTRSISRLARKILRIENVHLRCYARAAAMLKLEFDEIAPSVLEVRHQKGRFRFINAIHPFNSITSATLAENKPLCSKILKSAGAPVPLHRVFFDIKVATRFFSQNRNHGWVVKPTNGMSGIGVSVLPATIKDFSRAASIAYEQSSAIMVERFVSGRHFRIVVADGRVVVASERVPASVIGDGRSTIIALIRNKNRYRSGGPMKPQIRFDHEAKQTLLAQGFTEGDILPLNQKVFVHRKASFYYGGVSHDRSDELHPNWKRIAIHATKALDLYLAGIDLIVTHDRFGNPTPKAFINEVNHNPGLIAHCEPNEGTPREVALDILRLMLRRS